jgi:hypothetical protein
MMLRGDQSLYEVITIAQRLLLADITTKILLLLAMVATVVNVR